MLNKAYPKHLIETRTSLYKNKRVAIKTGKKMIYGTETNQSIKEVGHIYQNLLIFI